MSQGVRVGRAAGAGDVVLHVGTNLPGTTAFWLAKKTGNLPSGVVLG